VDRTVVPYSRFLELRERLERVRAALTRQPAAPPLGDSLRAQPIVIDCEAIRDKRCGTESASRGSAEPVSVEIPSRPRRSRAIVEQPPQTATLDDG
jgi:hypothetical protein